MKHETIYSNIETINLKHETSRNKCEYCVAIRTLGTAGEKYQTLLDSLIAQTLPPKKILVYIPHGYAAPKETVGVEQIVRCEKGMITQRSLSFEEIDTDFVLFCDDDLFLPPNYVEKMFRGLEDYNGDCIAVNVYNHHMLSAGMKLAIFLHNFVSPRRDDGRMVKMKRNGSYSYNNNPQSNYMLTESAPGASCLCKMYVYRSIHFEDERWLENMKFPAGEDNLFYYKMHIMGFRVLQYMNSGVIHLDAQVGQRPNQVNKMFLQKKNMVAMWYRIVYDVRGKSAWEKIRCLMAFGWRCLFGVFTLPLEVIHYKQPRFFIDYFRGLYAGYKYVHSEEYKKIPSFDNYLGK